MESTKIDNTQRFEKIKSENILDDIVNLYRPKIVGEEESMEMVLEG